MPSLESLAVPVLAIFLILASLGFFGLLIVMVMLLRKVWVVAENFVAINAEKDQEIIKLMDKGSINALSVNDKSQCIEILRQALVSQTEREADREDKLYSFMRDNFALIANIKTMHESSEFDKLKLAREANLEMQGNHLKYLSRRDKKIANTHHARMEFDAEIAEHKYSAKSDSAKKSSKLLAETSSDISKLTEQIQETNLALENFSKAVISTLKADGEF